MSQKSDKHTIEGVASREAESGGLPLFKIGFLLMVVFAMVLPFTSVGRKIMRELREILGGKARVVYVEKIVEKRVEVPGPDNIVEVKIPVVTEKKTEKKELITHFTKEMTDPVEDIRVLSNSSDIELKTHFGAEKSKNNASIERREREAYAIEYKVNVKLPKAAQTSVELEKVNPALNSILPGLKSLTLSDQAKVSPYYFEIYKNKIDRLKKNAPKLKALLSRHNFFDLQTILYFTSPSGRKVTLMQADMDVVSDGSDGDRLPSMPQKIVKSTHYQPFTSYAWKKTTTTPNPMLQGWKDRLKVAKKEVANPATTATRKAWVKERIKMLERGIEDMKYRSYLVAEHDPFIVIPVSMLTDMGDKHAPKVGDYALVIYQEKIYPCIVGDGGPTFKVGEASLRMAKEINKRASSYSRPVSDLSVTYLVFPNSRANIKKAPDYDEWRTKCLNLLEEIGGLGEGYELHTWTNTFPN